MNQSTPSAGKTASDDISKLCANTNLIPVVVINDVSKAIRLAQLFVESGFPVIEVTLRTPNALQVIEAMSKVDGVVLAAGTVTNQQAVSDAQSAGSQFLVSPGFSTEVHDAAVAKQIPLLPGASTATEIMHTVQHGYNLLKFFPADLNGGPKGITAFGSVFADLKFCPTGGVNMSNVKEYLSLQNVTIAGGSWMASSQQIKDGAWNEIELSLTQTRSLLDR